MVIQPVFDIPAESEYRPSPGGSDGSGHRGAVKRSDCFLVATQPDADRIASTIERSGYRVVRVPRLDGLRGRPDYAASVHPLVTVLAGVAPDDLLAGTLDFAEAMPDRAHLLYVAETIEPESYKRLLRTQRAEWCRESDVARELAEIGARNARSVAPERGGAHIVSFLASKGGVGNTTLVIEAAIRLAGSGKTVGPRIAVIDLDLDGGTLADALDVEPRLHVRELVERPDRLDNQLIDIFASRHSDRVDVFASPLRTSNAPAIEPDMIFAVLDRLAARYDLVLIDIPNRRDAYVDNLLQGSDAVVLSGSGVVPALKQIAARAAHLDALGIEPDKLVVVVNQCEADIFGRVARRQEIARALAGREIIFVREDGPSMKEANNAGRPVSDLHPRSRVSRDVRLVGDWIDRQCQSVAVRGAPS